MPYQFDNLKRGLINKRTLRSIVVIFIVMVVAATAFSWMFERYVLSKAEENITSLLLSQMGVHDYIQEILIPATTKFQEEGRIDSDFYAPELMSSSYFVRNQHAFYNLERKKAGYPELYYKMAANNPRNPINKADSLEAKLIEMFNTHRDIKSYKHITTIDGQRVLYVALPFLQNTKECLKCHGNREDAPLELQRRYPGEGGFNERIGEIRAITSIRAPLEHEFSSIYTIAIAIFAGSLAFAGLVFFNTRLRTRVQRDTKNLEKEIAERINAEATLKENRNTLKQILDTTLQSIFWKDMEGRYLGCNKVFARAIGYDDPEEIIGKTDFELPWPRQEAEAYRADDHEVMRSNKPKVHIIEPLQQADGTRLWVDTTKVPLHTDSGDVYGVLGVLEDITERKQAEEDRKDLEKRLQQAQKMEAIGTLAGGIAHDFNNILSVIFGYTEYAIDETDMDKRTKQLKQIKKGAERARDLVKQILTFSRRVDQSKHPVEISLIIKESLKMLRSSIPTTIDIVEDIAHTGAVMADPTQINQVIMNLCINAYHAMRERGGTLSVMVCEREIHDGDGESSHIAPGRYARLIVADTGTGIPADIRDRIFEPYFTTKSDGEGTGLGLAVVHGIVSSHGGYISIDSEANKGTQVTVHLPVHGDRAETAGSEEFPDAPAGSGERVLIIDDEVLVTEIISLHLSKNGYQVTVYNNAVQALEDFRLHPERFDLIITDMTMPYMTGAEFSQKALGIRPDIPIILCTGQSDIINRRKAMAMGVAVYLTKPILKYDLLIATQKALQKT